MVISVSHSFCNPSSMSLVTLVGQPDSFYSTCFSLFVSGSSLLDRNHSASDTHAWMIRLRALPSDLLCESAGLALTQAVPLPSSRSPGKSLPGPMQLSKPNPSCALHQPSSGYPGGMAPGNAAPHLVGARKIHGGPWPHKPTRAISRRRALYSALSPSLSLHLLPTAHLPKVLLSQCCPCFVIKPFSKKSHSRLDKPQA